MTKTTADCNEDGAGLLPCPFCGSGPLCSSSKVDAEPVAICFECPNGCSVSKEAPTYDGAVSIWNTRPTPPQNCCGQVEGVREALVAKLDERVKRLSQCLADLGWKPSRAHIEGARNTMQDVAAALRSIEPPGGAWQPIETAPRGVDILALEDFQREGDDGTKYPRDYQVVKKINGQWSSYGIYLSSFEPTHWQPLPTPPESPAGRLALSTSGRPLPASDKPGVEG